MISIVNALIFNLRSEFCASDFLWFLFDLFVDVSEEIHRIQGIHKNLCEFTIHCSIRNICMDLYGFVWISYEIDLLFAWILRNPVQNVSFFPTWAFLDWKRDKFTSTHRWEPLGWISGSSTSLLWPKWFLIEIISSACNQLFRSHDIKIQMLNLVVWKTTPSYS